MLSSCECENMFYLFGFVENMYFGLKWIKNLWGIGPCLVFYQCTTVHCFHSGIVYQFFLSFFFLRLSLSLFLSIFLIFSFLSSFFHLLPPYVHLSSFELFFLLSSLFHSFCQFGFTRLIFKSWPTILLNGRLNEWLSLSPINHF